LDVLSEEFTPSLLAPVQIVIDGYDRQEVRDQTQALQQQLAADADFRVLPIEVNQEGDVALMTVLLKGDPFASAATDSIYKLRHEYIGESFERIDARALVTGFTAFNDDFFKITREYTGIVFGFVLGLSFLLLMVAFRSVVIPLTSIIMNLLSVGAAYGLIVLVFQKGIGADLFGFQRIDSIDAWIPLFLFCILFGLSMDYYVFLLSRIREHYDKTGDNTESVAFGIRTTAGLITGAALIMLTVFIAFSRGQVAILQEMGFGLAMAVVMDATIVRVILVPSVMRLLGRRNWYFPSWLRWIPDVRVEPPSEEQEPAVEAGREQPDWDFVEM
jgi:RND superfamily putative drug exporter